MGAAELRLAAAAAAGWWIVAGAAAQTPRYGVYELQVRSNFATNPGGTYNIPGTHFFNSATPAINDLAETAIYVSTVGGSDVKKVWFGGRGQGGIVYESPADASLSDVSLNNAGLIVFPQDFASPVGIVRVDGRNGGSTVAVPPGGPFGITGFGSPQINGAGHIGFRGQTSGVGQQFISADGAEQARHVAEVGVDPASPYSFLFTPALNDARQIAGKARVGGPGQTGNSQPDEIRVWNADGSSTLIAVDRDGDPASPYTSFDNSVSVNAAGQVAFIADLAGGGRAVLLADGVETIEIARSGVGGVGSIEFFRPAVNDRGVVAFRAFDSDGRRAVWAGDGTRLRRVVTEHDVLPTDLGEARVDQHDGSPVFGGNVSINYCGDVAFQCGLTPPDNNQVEWGSGLFVAYASPDPDFDGDGSLTPADFSAFRSAFLAGDPSADVNCDRALTPADFSAFRTAFLGG